MQTRHNVTVSVPPRLTHSPPTSQDQFILDPTLARQLLSALARRGADTHALVDGLGFSPAQIFAADFKLSVRSMRSLVHRATAQWGQPHAGLELGCMANPVSWGEFLVGALAARDVETMLRLAAEFLPGVQGLAALSPSRHAQGLWLTAHALHDDTVLHDFVVEKAFASLVQLCRFVLGPAYAPLAAEFTQPAAAQQLRFQRALGCDVRFGRPANRLLLPGCDRHLPTADSLVFERARGQLMRERSRFQAGGQFTLLVGQLVQRSAGKVPTFEAVAQALHLSSRTLRRRLAAEGSSYAVIVDHERRRRALGLLKQDGMPLEAIAEHCGFSGGRSLRRATRRWTGQPIVALRAGSADTGEEPGPCA